MTAVMEVRESYINAAFDEIDAKYGSMDNFLKEKLGLTDAKKRTTKKKPIFIKKSKPLKKGFFFLRTNRI